VYKKEATDYFEISVTTDSESRYSRARSTGIICWGG